MKRQLLTGLVGLGWLGWACLAHGEPTNNLDTFKAAYRNAEKRYIAECEQQKQQAQKAYGVELEALLKDLKAKGDLDAYLVVAAENKRFVSENTMPAGTNGNLHPLIRQVVGRCEKVVTLAEDNLNRRMVALLKDYLAALDWLIKKLMGQDNIDEAKLVKAEKDTALQLLAELEARLPPLPPPPPIAGPKTNIPVTVVGRKPVPKEAVEYKGHHYLLISGQIAWNQAKQECERLGGHLVIITDAKEDEFFQKLTDKKNVWIGLSDEKKSGEFHWVDGTLPRYTRWQPGDPNGPTDAVNVVRTVLLPPCGWGDCANDATGSVVGYVCEWDY